MSHKLNKEQKQAVEYTNGPLLIVAGAGTGKTTVVTKKIAYLIEKGLATPENILALTFTDKAAYEMQERVDELVDVGYTDMQISTFHAFCQAILKEYALDIGLPGNFKLLTETDVWLLVRKNLAKFNLDYYRPLGNPTQHIHELIKHFSKCKDELVTAEEYLEYAKEIHLSSRPQQSGVERSLKVSNKKDSSTVARNDNGGVGEIDEDEKDRLTEIAGAYHTYNQLLLDNEVLDFGDLIFYTLKLLEKRPQILKSITDRFKYILIDEFQDVNFSQYKLVQKITGEQNQLTVVGDDDQSIYAFRGANVQNILRFKKDFKNTKEIVLTKNYRSGQKILDLAYDSIQNNNPNRLEVELKINKKLKSEVSQKGEIIHSHHSTLDQEIGFVVQEIKRLKEINKEVVWDDFAILIRANSHAENFTNVLEKNGIPNEFLAASGLYKQPIVLDCINFLKIIEDNSESASIYRLLQLPFFNFSAMDMQNLSYNRKKKSISFYWALKFVDQLKLSTHGSEVVDKLLKLINQGMEENKRLKPTEILVNFLDSSGYNEYLINQENEGDRFVIRQIYQLKQFFEYIKRYEDNNPGTTVVDFIEHFNFLIESGEQGSMQQLNDTADSVNIITTHRSKGMEYKYVFIVNLVEDRFPSRRKGKGIEIPSELLKEDLLDTDIHFEEERRLFYVAITRAKEKLYLTSASDYGGVRKKKISRFLDEIGYKADTNITPEKNHILKPADKIKESKGKFVYQIPKAFSISQIKTYLTCPYQYKLQYILNIPQKGKGVFSYGSTMHNTLEKFYQKIQELNTIKQDSLFGLPADTTKTKLSDNKIKVPTLDELLKLYEENWINDWYSDEKQRKDYFAKGKETLMAYYKKHEGNWTVPVSLEGYFKISIEGNLINGRIDRIDQTKEGLQIIDYKTGKGKDKLSTDDKDQLLLYQIATSELAQYRNIGEVKKLTYYYLDKDLSELDFIGKDKQIENFKIKITKAIENIKAGKFDACSNFGCKYCAFKDICEKK